jgi:acyl carrier protein
VSEHDAIRHFVASRPKYLGTEDELTDDRELITEGILDSVGVYQLVGFLEERFGVQVTDDDIVFENFATVNDVAALVARRRV